MSPVCYILQCADGAYYVGSSKDFQSRLKAHRSGQVKSTSHRLPIFTVHTETFETYPQAVKRERQIKSWKSRKAIERLINNSGPIV